MPDLSPREILVFAPIVVVVLWMGIYPTSFLKPMQPSLTALVERVESAKKQAALKAAPPTRLATAAETQR